MSRRRKPGKPSVVAASFITVRVCCKGRGTHNRVNLGTVRVFPDLRDEWGRGVTYRLEADEFYVQPEVDRSASDDEQLRALMGHKTITLMCGRCTPRRNVPLTRPTADRIFTDLALAGAPELDISALGALGPL